MMEMAKRDKVEEGLVIYADHQTKGKGQRGNIWLDHPGKNILASILLSPTFLLPPEQYLLNVTVGLSVIKTVSRYLNQSTVHLKWPNDVLIDDRKISGILIENVLQGNRLEKAIVGVGINLNQDDFGVFPATSIFRELGKLIERTQFIEELLLDIEHYYLMLKNNGKEMLLQMYHEKLYQKGVVRKYEDKDGLFEGTILGIDATGKLIVNREGTLTHYGIKEINFY